MGVCRVINEEILVRFYGQHTISLRDHFLCVPRPYFQDSRAVVPARKSQICVCQLCDKTKRPPKRHNWNTSKQKEPEKECLNCTSVEESQYTHLGDWVSLIGPRNAAHLRSLHLHFNNYISTTFPHVSGQVPEGKFDTYKWAGSVFWSRYRESPPNYPSGEFLEAGLHALARYRNLRTIRISFATDVSWEALFRRRVPSPLYRHRDNLTLVLAAINFCNLSRLGGRLHEAFMKFQHLELFEIDGEGKADFPRYLKQLFEALAGSRDIRKAYMGYNELRTTLNLPREADRILKDKKAIEN